MAASRLHPGLGKFLTPKSKPVSAADRSVGRGWGSRLQCSAQQPRGPRGRGLGAEHAFHPHKVTVTHPGCPDGKPEAQSDCGLTHLIHSSSCTSDTRMQFFPRGNVFLLRKAHKSVWCLPLPTEGGSLCLPWSLCCSLPGCVVPSKAARQQPCSVRLVHGLWLRSCRSPQETLDCAEAAMLEGDPNHTEGLHSAHAPAGEAHPGEPSPSCPVTPME